MSITKKVRRFSRCRLCLEKDSSLIHAFEDRDTVDFPLVATIEEMLKLVFSDKGHFPPTVCQDCITRLRAFRTYKLHVNKCNRVLEILLREKGKNFISNSLNDSEEDEDDVKLTMESDSEDEVVFLGACREVISSWNHGSGSQSVDGRSVSRSSTEQDTPRVICLELDEGSDRSPQETGASNEPEESESQVSVGDGNSGLLRDLQDERPLQQSEAADQSEADEGSNGNEEDVDSQSTEASQGDGSTGEAGRQPPMKIQRQRRCRRSGSECSGPLREPSRRLHERRASGCDSAAEEGSQSIGRRRRSCSILEAKVSNASKVMKKPCTSGHVGGISEKEGVEGGMDTCRLLRSASVIPGEKNGMPSGGRKPKKALKTVEPEASKLEEDRHAKRLQQKVEYERNKYRSLSADKRRERNRLCYLRRKMHYNSLNKDLKMEYRRRINERRKLRTTTMSEVEKRNARYRASQRLKPQKEAQMKDRLKRH